MTEYIFRHYDDLLEALAEHIQIVAVSLFFSLLIAGGLTVASAYSRKMGEILIQIFSVVYAIPSLALFALLIPVTGLGVKTAVIVLTAYNQYILLRNFITGLNETDAAAVEAARGIGMSVMQVLVRVRLPLGKKAVFTGIQLSAVSTIGIATIAAMINAGGLGTILFDGLRTMNVYKILCGSILSAGLALLVNGVFGTLERRLYSGYRP